MNKDVGIEAMKVAGHDLKTPLTSLKILAQLFKIEIERGTLVTNSERMARNCQMLMDQVDKLASLADTLLEVSRAQSDRLKFNFERQDLSVIVKKVFPQASTPGILVLGNYDSERLKQAFEQFASGGKDFLVSLVLLPEHKAKLTISGNFKSNLPKFYLAQTIIEKHGGHLEGAFEITLPTQVCR